MLANKTFIRPILGYVAIVRDPRIQTNVAKLEKVKENQLGLFSTRTACTHLYHLC